MTEGVSVNLQHFVEFTPAVDNWRFWPAEKWLTSANPQTGEQGYGPALNAVRFSTHEGTLSTSMQSATTTGDRRWPEIDPDYRVTFNNHRNRRDELSCQGESGVLGMGPGYVTRGVLVDIALFRNVKWLEPTTPIFADELEKWEQFAGVKSDPATRCWCGPAAGRSARRKARGRTARAAPGCTPRCCRGCTRAACRCSSAMR